MQRPIEKYGWKKIRTLEDYDESFENKISKEKISFRKCGYISLDIDKDNEITFEELRAICETAKQIAGIKDYKNTYTSVEPEFCEYMEKEIEKQIKGE